MKGICWNIWQVFQMTKITFKHLGPQIDLDFEGHVPWFWATGNPAAKRLRKGANIHIVKFLSRHCMYKVVLLRRCSRRVLGGLPQKNAVSGAIVGSRAEDTFSSSCCCRRCITPTAESFTQENIPGTYTRESSNYPSTGSALFTIGYAHHMHTCRRFEPPAPS